MNLTAHQQLAEKWVDAGKAHLIEQDDPSWWAAVKALDIKKHYGPGPHPGTGTPQSVHGGGRSTGESSPPKRASQHVHHSVEDISRFGTESKSGQRFAVSNSGYYCSECGYPVWRRKASERADYARQAEELRQRRPGAKSQIAQLERFSAEWSHDGTHYGPTLPSGIREKITVRDQSGDGLYFADSREKWIYLGHMPTQIEQVDPEVWAWDMRISTEEEAFRAEGEFESELRHESANARHAVQRERNKIAQEERRRLDEEAVKGVLDRGAAVTEEIRTELAKVDATLKANQKRVEEIRSMRNVDSAKALKARSILATTTSEIAHFEASRHRGVSQDEVYAALRDESRGSTVRERLESWRADIEIGGKENEPFEVPGTRTQKEHLRGDLNGSETADAVRDAGVVFKGKTWRIPNRAAGKELLHWAEMRRDLAWTESEAKTFRRLVRDVKTAVDSIPSGQSKAAETFWALGGSRSGDEPKLSRSQELIDNDWLRSATWVDSASTIDTFTTDTPIWDASYKALFMGENPAERDRQPDSSMTTYPTSQIVDSLLVQADYFEPYLVEYEGQLEAASEEMTRIASSNRFAQANVIRDVLSRHREFTDRPVDVKRKTKTAKKLQEDSLYYPAAWVEASNAKGPLSVQHVNGRGHYNDRNGQIKVEPWGSQHDTIVHELGHRMEHVVPALSQAEKVFYEYRTRDSQIADLQALRPGSRYRSGETSRPDKFSDPYMGKRYSGGAFELISMGAPRLLGFVPGEKNRWNNPDTPFGMDEEMVHFIVGVMAGT